jgi:signal transduction histidine kinase
MGQEEENIVTKKTYKKPEISKKQLEQELMEASVALWQANQRLEAEEKSRTEMLANLSHDLRSSMTAIANAVELLKNGQEMEAAQYQELICLIERRMDMQRSMVDNLFFLAKLESTPSFLQKEPVACGPFLEEYFYSCTVDPKYAACDLQLEVPEDFPYEVEMDAPSIIRVLDNLFANAQKYAGSGAQIRLGAEKKEQEVWISVADNGPGIPQEDLPFLFDRTFRGSRSRTPGDGGSGLGLAIAREITAQHGGRIWCESNREKGSCFTFSLPVLQEKT